MLKGGEKCGCHLLEELNITQPTLSHHMKILCDAGIVDSCKEGKWMHYSICENGSRIIKEIVSFYALSDDEEKNYRKCKCGS